MASQFQLPFSRPRRSATTPDSYVAAVIVAGVLVCGFLARGAVAAFRDADLTFWVLAACVFPAEILRFKLWRRGTTQDVTMSRAFAFALLTGWGAPVTVVVFVIASVVSDLNSRRTDHKPLVRIPFNAAQYALSIAAAGAVYTMLGGQGSVNVGQLPAFLAAAVVLIMVNRLLVRVVIALHEQQPLTIGNLLAAAQIELVEGAIQCGVVLIALAVAGHRLILPAVLALPAVPMYVAGRAADRAEALMARRQGLGGDELADLKQRHKAVLRTVELQLANLAADYHDGPVQLLQQLVTQIQMVKASIATGRPDAAQLLHEVEERVTGELRTQRLMVAELRPPVLARQGLAGALTRLAQKVQTTSEIVCVVHAGPVEGLSEELEVVLYRVAQEALTNVVKHACASHVQVTVAVHEGAVRLQIHDDGGGFDPQGVPEDGHYGLALHAMRVEVAGGAFQVDSMPGAGGTTITVKIPLS